MNVTTNCQQPHTPHWPLREEEMCVLSFLLCMCWSQGTFFSFVKKRTQKERKNWLFLCYSSVACKRFCVNLCVCPSFNYPQKPTRDLAHWDDWGPGGVSAGVRGLFTYHDGWEWARQRGILSNATFDQYSMHALPHAHAHTHTRPRSRTRTHILCLLSLYSNHEPT